MTSRKIRIGYFCTDGYTEIYGLPDFLKKINENVIWDRCYPARPRLVPGAPPPPPSGTSGDDLLRKMRQYLRFGWDYDYLLIVDDEDCRFHGKDMGEFQAWKDELQNEICRLAGRDVELLVLLASPEIEAWLLADWENGFGGRYESIQHCVNKNIRHTMQDFFENPEGYGDGFNGDSCNVKLSDQLEHIVKLCGINGEVFSKQIDSAEMLKQIDPERVGRRCSRYFAPTYQRLKELC